MLDLIRQIFSLTFAISMTYILLGCEIKNKRAFYLFLAYSLSVLLINAYILKMIGYVGFMKLYPLLVNVPALVGFVLLSKRRIFKVLFVELTVIALAVSITTVGIMISYFFDGDTAIVNIVSYILYVPVWFLVYKYIRPSFLYMMDSTENGWLSFCLIPLCYCLLIYSISKYNLDNIVIGRIIRNVVLFFVMGFSAYYMILKFFDQTRKQIAMQKEENLLKIQIQTAKLHFESLKEVHESILVHKHDMRHHLHLINAYLTDNNKEAAQKYIADIDTSIEKSAMEKYCNNYIVNLILSSYIAIAKEAQINVVSNIQLPEDSMISDMDLCVIFANAIENATNACRLVEDPQYRLIHIHSKVVNQNLQIQIQNSFHDPIEFVDEIPFTRKENHGLGVKSMVSVTRKYGGFISFTTEGNIFKVSISL
ncbi:MAG: ATP-binding protein [Clostridia bacterium]|nr:ATP-binding protein [Clostridia bacterium]